MAQQSISFRQRDKVNEVYLFPIGIEKPTFNQKNSVLMIEELENEKVRVIAGNIPGTGGYFDNHPDAVEDNEERQERHRNARERVNDALKELEEFDPETSYSESHQGNEYLDDIYVEIDEDRRDEVVLKMWKVLNDLKEDYYEKQVNEDLTRVNAYSELHEEVLDISKRLDMNLQKPNQIES